ncbi:MAG: hypothetical protein ABJC61_12355 [Acidobacteriota bacterium]
MKPYALRDQVDVSHPGYNLGKSEDSGTAGESASFRESPARGLVFRGARMPEPRRRGGGR